MGSSTPGEGLRFEHYRVAADAQGKPVKLGEGAMGVTYLAEDTNLRVKVALKVIRPSLLGDAEVVQRFQREAQAAARLRHPNVAAVYHLGVMDDTFFYTMEFVEGVTLHQRLQKKGPLSVKEALEVTLQMCEALGAAERHHMVHRDIKPANIMIESEEEEGLHAKLIDFGLVKPSHHGLQEASAVLTQRGTFLGTAVFASPEQVQDLPVDIRSDFYSLGLTLWAMLEGRPPFEGSLAKVLSDQVNARPPLERLFSVPAEVRMLLGRLLEKDAAARPQSARELRQMIQDCLRLLRPSGADASDWHGAAWSNAGGVENQSPAPSEARVLFPDKATPPPAPVVTGPTVVARRPDASVEVVVQQPPARMAGMMAIAPPSIFLSYASEDRAIARALRDVLAAYGLDVWYDENELGGGDSWDRKIRGRIRDCDYFMPIISATTERRKEGYFRREWHDAIQRTLAMADDVMFLLPVSIDNTGETSSRVPEEFRAVQWLRLPGGEPTPALDALCRRILAIERTLPPRLDAPTTPRSTIVQPVAEKPHETKATPAPHDEPDLTVPLSASLPAIKSRVTELPLVGQSAHLTGTAPGAGTREAPMQESQQVRPAFKEAAHPDRKIASGLPRWIPIVVGSMAVVLAVALYFLVNRPVPEIAHEPGKSVVVPSDPGASKPADVVPVPPPPPSAPSLDQLLQVATEAVAQHDLVKLAATWQDMQARFPTPQWNASGRATAFTAAVVNAYKNGKLGPPEQATRSYLPVLDVAAKEGDISLLTRLALDLKSDATAAQAYELALLDALSRDTAKGETLLDESLRLVQLRPTGKVTDRARDLIRQKLAPIVASRERNPRPEDIDAALRNALQALTPKLEALAATGEPVALYLYADKLRKDGRAAESVDLFEKAALGGHSPSMLQLGLLLSNDADKAVSLPRAVQWFKTGAAKGHPQCDYALGECYLDGKGVARDYDLALKHLEAAAAKDIAEAHYLLGGTYLEAPSGGAPPDTFNPARLNPTLTGEARLKKARGHLDKALQSGFSPAGGLLAGMLIQGQGGPRDIARGVQLLDAATLIGKPDPNHLRNLAYLLMEKLLDGLPVTRAELDAANVKPNPKRAEDLMRQAARMGDVPAQQWCEENGITR